MFESCGFIEVAYPAVSLKIFLVTEFFLSTCGGLVGNERLRFANETCGRIKQKIDVGFQCEASLSFQSENWNIGIYYVGILNIGIYIYIHFTVVCSCCFCF